MKNSIIKLIGNIATSIWCWWSNYRFKSCIRSNIGIEPQDKVITLSDIKALVRRLYTCFIWTADGLDQLGDAITPPPQNYAIYLERPLKDDCDGFHSLLYHCLYNNNIECYLLTANPFKGGGHCVLIFKLDDLWHVADYNRIYIGHKSIIDSINDYNKEYSIRYKTSEVVYNGFVSYNYTDGKFKRENLI